MLNHVLRYQPVVDALDEVHVGDILDVGSGSRGVRPHLVRKVPVTACDVSFDDYGSANVGQGSDVERVHGSVLSLPFDDTSFDGVIALDLLEHLEPDDRPRALAELARVTRVRLVVGCPCGRAALESDRRVAILYGRLRRPIPGWLAEHLSHGFPDARELELELSRSGSVTLFPNSSARSGRLVASAEATPGLWRLPFWASELLRRGLLHHRTRPFASRAARALRGGDGEPSYRTIAVLDPLR